ncbi:MAG: hypothetical protein ACE5PM_09640 [Candidatus Hydrothermarchaeales archaeon]
MTASTLRTAKAGEISLPQEIMKKLKITKEDVLTFEIVDKETLKVKILRKGDYESDPLWKVIHDPAKPKIEVTAKNLQKLEDELWAD